jgi:hypothetical protein
LTILTGTTHFHWTTIAGAVLDANCLYSGSQDWVWLWTKCMNVRIMCKKWLVRRQKAGLHSQSPSIHATSNKPHTQTQQIQCNIKNE